MTTATEIQYIFLRVNLGDSHDAPATRLTEREARTYISTSVQNVDRAIDRLKRGQQIRTRFATYTAEVIHTGALASSIS